MIFWSIDDRHSWLALVDITWSIDLVGRSILSSRRMAFWLIGDQHGWTTWSTRFGWRSVQSIVCRLSTRNFKTDDYWSIWSTWFSQRHQSSVVRRDSAGGQYSWSAGCFILSDYRWVSTVDHQRVTFRFSIQLVDWIIKWRHVFHIT